MIELSRGDAAILLEAIIDLDESSPLKLSAVQYHVMFELACKYRHDNPNWVIRYFGRKATEAAEREAVTN